LLSHAKLIYTHTLRVLTKATSLVDPITKSKH